MRRRSDVSGAWQTVGDAWEPPVLAIAFLGALPKQSLQILEVDAVQPDGVVIRVLGGRLHLRLGEEETELAPGGWCGCRPRCRTRCAPSRRRSCSSRWSNPDQAAYRRSDVLHHRAASERWLAMAGADGTHTLGPATGELLVKTRRTGLGAKAGHDLTIEVTRWRGRATVDTAQPSRSSVTVEVDIDSFEVREGAGGVKPLTDSDRADIKKTLREKVLHTERHPTITYRSTRVDGSPESFTVEGELTIIGVTRPVILHGRVTDGHVRGSATVVQTEWGIRPYSAFFGALRLRDDVEVELDVALTPAAGSP